VAAVGVAVRAGEQRPVERLAHIVVVEVAVVEWG
jgi:hypothetical protein